MMIGQLEVFFFSLSLFSLFCRKTLVQFGIPDQVRVDCGCEFHLMLGMHENLAHFRGNQTIRCYLQTESKQVITVL